MKLSYKEMMCAFVNDDDGYDGSFYVGVRSTGIYCLPSCKARLPKVDHILFYETREEAIAAGLRGCKRCKAEKYPDILPSWLPRLLSHLSVNRASRITEQSLRQMADVDISTVRRYFKKHLQTTPLAFHRRARLAYARELIESGCDYLNAAFECGYESSSGFRSAFARQYGKPPGAYYAK